MSRYWQVEEIEILIKLAKVRPCLWDVENKNYNDYASRYGAYKEISKEMEKSGFHLIHPEVLRSKFNNLRAQYYRIYRDPEKRNSPKRWMHFDSLNFLNKGNNPETEEGKALSVCSNEEILNAWGFDANDLVEKDDELEDLSAEDLSNDADDRKAISKIKPKDAKCINQNMKPCSKRKSTNSATETLIKEKDTHAVFGEHVANELRMLKHDKRLQQTLKCAIIKAILQANQALIS